MVGEKAGVGGDARDEAQTEGLGGVLGVGGVEKDGHVAPPMDSGSVFGFEQQAQDSVSARERGLSAGHRDGECARGVGDANCLRDVGAPGCLSREGAAEGVAGPSGIDGAHAVGGRPLLSGGVT